MDGILIVNKPQGMTSHDVVDFIRRRFGVKKVGHAGTLDPMATGVLVILIGKLTKSQNRYMSGDKEYDATLTLGAESNTGDAWGKITPSVGSIDFSPGRIEEAFKKFSGEIEQAVPMYSAAKHNGRKLYELARKGMTVVIEPKKVTIKKIAIQNISLPEVSFSVTCSKGTYIRQLAVDIGKDLGCGAYLSRLVRTRSGEFDIDETIGIDKLKEMDIAELKSVIRLSGDQGAGYQVIRGSG
jgi:tRNA pseudouridine55 synthase